MGILLSCPRCLNQNQQKSLRFFSIPQIQILVYQIRAYTVEAAKMSKASQAVTVVRGIMERTALVRVLITDNSV